MTSKGKKDNPIETKTKRLALAPRREPYWYTYRKGEAVGFRVSTLVDGQWQARWTEQMTNEKKTKSLGQFEDLYDEETGLVSDRAYDQAVAAAMKWAQDMRGGIVNTNPTVWHACEHYLESFSGRPSAKADALGRLDKKVKNDPLAKVRLSKITRAHLKAWMNRRVLAILARNDEESDDAEALRKARDSANRDFRTLRAALNMAKDDGLCSSDTAWSSKVEFPATDASRGNYLSAPQTKAWIAAMPEPLALFMRALLMTGARPGELAGATVGDFDPANSCLWLYTGKGKENQAKKRRQVYLLDEAVELLKVAGRGRIANARLLVDAFGQPWSKETWKACKPFVAVAGLPPQTTAYDLRHAAISRWLAGGVGILDIARLAGTSVEMIQKNYGHLLESVTRKAMVTAAKNVEGA